MLVRLENRDGVIQTVLSENDLFNKRAAIHRKRASSPRAQTAAFRIASIKQDPACMVLGPVNGSESWLVKTTYAGAAPPSGSILFCNLETGLCQVRSSQTGSIGEFLAFSATQKAAG